jgi:hypothetical protein
MLFMVPNVEIPSDTANKKQPERISPLRLFSLPSPRGTGRGRIYFERFIADWHPIINQDGRGLMSNAGESFMRHIIHSTTTRTQGWQADCWNWAKARMPFELYGIQTHHLEFCRALSSACRLRFHSRQFRDEAVAMFEPSFTG